LYGKKIRGVDMIFELLFGAYLVLFCLGFWADLRLSKASNNKYYYLSMPLTAPVIGAKLLMEKFKSKPKATV